VTLLHLLAIVAVAQAIFVVLLAAFVLLRRGRLARRAHTVQVGRGLVSAPLAQWLAGSGTARRAVEALNRLPPDAALGFATELHDTRVPLSMRRAFGIALREEKWVGWALRGCDSVRWWRRLDAARALGVVGTARDADMLRPLIGDEHPAVRLAASQALAAVDDPELVKIAVERFPGEALAVRHFMMSTLKETWRLAEEPLRQALESPASAQSLAAWLVLAEALALPSLRPQVTALVHHESGDVRASAARTLRRYPHAGSVDAAALLMRDPVDYVRAAAAQTLGILRASETQPLLEQGLTDGAWWVRFRSALSLAMLGEPGRAALRRTRTSPDRFAREMAEVASGLSDGAVLEMADA
jgi:HEAT repeat protein